MSDYTPPLPDYQVLIDALQAKIHQLVDDFASGKINRVQFHELYDRYHYRMTRITQLAHNLADPDTQIGQEIEDTFNLKKRLTARVLGVSIYGNQTGLPIETIGEFAIDPALIVPMLSSYRAATREIFRAGMRSTIMDNNQWLCFVPGNFTTLIALFSVEPATVQLSALEQMHRDFEEANQAALASGHADPALLAYPFLTFVRKAHQTHATTGSFPPSVR
ncbi:MAG: hypothetical protein IT324_03290 [Anaerolineae bacterium]|nr:hypothetical protein [Anaerolineae bacterium]